MKGKISEMMPIERNPDEYAVKRMISAYGIPTPKSVLMDSKEREVELEFPVVVKVSDPKILHKSEVGGVTIGVRDRKQLAEEISQMKVRFPGLMNADIPMPYSEIASMVSNPRAPLWDMNPMFPGGGKETLLYDVRVVLMFE